MGVQEILEHEFWTQPGRTQSDNDRFCFDVDGSWTAIFGEANIDAESESDGNPSSPAQQYDTPTKLAQAENVRVRPSVRPWRHRSAMAKAQSRKLFAKLRIRKTFKLSRTRPVHPARPAARESMYS